MKVKTVLMIKNVDMDFTVHLFQDKQENVLLFLQQHLHVKDLQEIAHYLMKIVFVKKIK